MNLEAMGQQAVVAKYVLQALSTQQKNQALAVVAEALKNNKEKLLQVVALTKPVMKAMEMPITGMYGMARSPLRILKSFISALPVSMASNPYLP